MRGNECMSGSKQEKTTKDEKQGETKIMHPEELEVSEKW